VPGMPRRKTWDGYTVLLQLRIIHQLLMRGQLVAANGRPAIGYLPKKKKKKVPLSISINTLPTSTLHGAVHVVMRAISCCFYSPDCTEYCHCPGSILKEILISLGGYVVVHVGVADPLRDSNLRSGCRYLDGVAPGMGS